MRPSARGQARAPGTPTMNSRALVAGDNASMKSGRVAYDDAKRHEPAFLNAKLLSPTKGRLRVTQHRTVGPFGRITRVRRNNV